MQYSVVQWILPVEQQQQGEHWQVGGRYIGFLLKTDENEDDQRCRDNVVTLQRDTHISNMDTHGAIHLVWSGEGGIVLRLTMSQMKLATQ